MFGTKSIKDGGVWRAAEKPDYLKWSGRQLIHNGYNKGGVFIVVLVTIVNAFT
jgi:hypothetical protein